MADAQGQTGLSAFQGLALALLVTAQNQRPIGRVQIQADHVPELGLELRIVRQLVGPPQMRLDMYASGEGRLPGIFGT